MEYLHEEIEFCKDELSQKEQYIKDLHRQISILERNEDTSLSSTSMSVEDVADLSVKEINFKTNLETKAKTKSNVKTNKYKEMMANMQGELEDCNALNASLESQLLLATTNAYAGISLIWLLKDIPEESREANYEQVLNNNRTLKEWINTPHSSKY